MKKINISDNVHRTFANRFLKWGILLNEAVINAASAHVINKDKWKIKFVQGQDDQGHYLEFYAIHPDKADSHFKIYESGDVTELPALTEDYDCNPSLPGQCSIERESFIEKNKEIYESLKRVGLEM
jgi:hypothetical protein